MQQGHEDSILTVIAIAGSLLAVGCALHVLTHLSPGGEAGDMGPVLALTVLILGPGAGVAWWLHVRYRRWLERRAALFEDLSSPDPEARAAAAAELASGAGFEPGLAAVADDPSPYVRAQLAGALGGRGTEALPLLGTLLGDSHTNVRRAAARSLHVMIVRREALLPPDLDRFPDLEAALLSAAVDPDRDTQEKAQHVLRALGREGGAGGADVPPAPLDESLMLPEQAAAARPETQLRLLLFVGGCLLLAAVVGLAGEALSPAPVWPALRRLCVGLLAMDAVAIALVGGQVLRNLRQASRTRHSERGSRDAGPWST